MAMKIFKVMAFVLVSPMIPLTCKADTKCEHTNTESTTTNNVNTKETLNMKDNFCAYLHGTKTNQKILSTIIIESTNVRRTIKTENNLIQFEYCFRYLVISKGRSSDELNFALDVHYALHLSHCLLITISNAL